MADAGVSKVEIERSANMITVTIHAAKPGIVIGKSGVKVEELRRTLEAMTGKRIRVTIQEIRQPEVDAMLVARSIADQLEKRVAFRRAMKQAVQRAQRFGAKGVRVQVSGRLGGSEMSRREWDRWGRVPLHTLRADIDYGQTEAHTTYGVIGVKVLDLPGRLHARRTQPRRGRRRAATAGSSRPARHGARRGARGASADLRRRRCQPRSTTRAVACSIRARIGRDPPARSGEPDPSAPTPPTRVTRRPAAPRPPRPRE